MSLHDWFGYHAADFRASRRDRGSFVSRRSGRPMIKLPRLTWQLRPKAT